MVIFFCISQILGSAAILYLAKKTADAQGAYYRYSIALTGISGLVTMIPAVWLYRRDKNRRRYGSLVCDPPGVRLTVCEKGLLLVLGAGLAFYVNLFVGILQSYMENNTYQDMMDKITMGYSIWEMILWMGIVAPIAEEMIFRWLIYLRLRDHMSIFASSIISAAIFGIFHGNFVQAVYAGILGVAMAYILEMSGNIWSSVLVHMGANIFSLILSEIIPKFLEIQDASAIMAANTGILLMYVLLLAAVIAGLHHFMKKGESRGYRAV